MPAAVSDTLGEPPRLRGHRELSAATPPAARPPSGSRRTGAAEPRPALSPVGVQHVCTSVCSSRGTRVGSDARAAPPFPRRHRERLVLISGSQV